MKLNLVRSTSFNCVHFYEVKDWSSDQNLKEFGPCFSPTGHGHTYRFEAHISGAVDPITGMILNLRDFDLSLKKVTSLLEGKHLNHEVAEFQKQMPTTENILEFLTIHLKMELSKYRVQLTRAKLFETEDLWVESESF